ncbi:MAG: membrane protein insertase YidC [candidate division Zixibacteria bacterium]|nr:membrane protein insertase YidC [candidate division Zixibacteria bacterium]
MEKRALLAFILIILVWVGYYYLVVPTVAPPPAPIAPAPTGSAEPVPAPRPSQTQKTPTTTTDTAPPSVAPEPDAWDRTEKLRVFDNDSTRLSAPREIVVEGDFFRGVLNTQGGLIQSWKLKKYPGLNEPWVEIVPPDREYGPDVILTTEEGPVSFREILFEADTDVVTLGATRPQGTLELRGMTASGVSIVKRFIFDNADYAFRLEIEMDGVDRLPLGSKYYLRWGGGLRITETEWERDVTAFRGFAVLGDAVVEQDLGTEPEDPKPEDSGDARWVAVRSMYFLAALVPQERPGKGIRLNGRPVSTGAWMDRQISTEIAMGLSATVKDRFMVYLGPIHYDTLAGYQVGLENTVDLGWSFVRPISRFILNLLVWLHQFISNYGVVIIVLSVIVKIALYPLTYKSMKAAQGMQGLQPKMEALREKYKNDTTKLNQEMMKMYRESGVNPLGGCLPLILQMPILYALYAIFSSTIELRNAPFMAWISDLSLKDPFYVLPVLMGVTMFIQSKMTMKDPKQAVFVYLMPIMLFFFMKDLSSGLILYWTMINILTILQQAIQNRFFPASPVTM